MAQYSAPRAAFGIGNTPEVGPKHIRLKMDGSGKPSIQIHRHLFSRNVEVEAEFELGVFGEELKNLTDVLDRHQVPREMVKIENVQLIPIDPKWNDELGLSMETSIAQQEVPSFSSLYYSFMEISSEIINSPSLSDGVVWRGKVWMSLTLSGRNLFTKSLKNGSFSFPLVARVQLDTAPSLNAQKIDRKIDRKIEMMIPGGLACLRRGFWGQPKARALSDCAHYWQENSSFSVQSE